MLFKEIPNGIQRHSRLHSFRSHTGGADSEEEALKGECVLTKHLHTKDEYARIPE
jgi:hypothetical protein